MGSTPKTASSAALCLGRGGSGPRSLSVREHASLRDALVARSSGTVPIRVGLDPRGSGLVGIHPIPVFLRSRGERGLEVPIESVGVAVANSSGDLFDAQIRRLQQLRGMRD